MAFLDAVNKWIRYNVCVYQLKALKQVVNEVNSGQKANSKVRMMFFEVEIQQAIYAWCF